jgi:hypothetical protein
VKSLNLTREATPNNLLDRVLLIERKLKHLERFAAMARADPKSGTGGVTYEEIVQEVVLTEGDAIDITGSSPEYTINLGMEYPLIWDGTNPPTEYATLALAIAAASDGDTILLPPGTYSGNHLLPAGGTLAGVVRADCLLTGQITLSNLSHVENLTIDRDENSADTLYGLVGPAVGEVAYAKSVTISVTNTGVGVGRGLTVFGKGDLGSGIDDPGLVDCDFVGCDLDIVR